MFAEGVPDTCTTKFAFENSLGLQLLPQRSDIPPSDTTPSVAVSVGVVLVVVQVDPPFHESATLIVPAAVVPDTSIFTSIPWIVSVPGTLCEKELKLLVVPVLSEHR